MGPTENICILIQVMAWHQIGAQSNAEPASK